jgi:Condensation domain
MADSGEQGGGRSRWLVREIGTGTSTQCVVASARFPGRPDITALRCALHVLADRHAALRMIFPPAVEPAKRAVRMAQLCLREATAGDLDDDQLAMWAGYVAREPFDLARGPRLRIHVYRMSAQEVAILVVGHHFIVDVWSMTTLVRELGVVYAERAGHMLPALARSTPGGEELVRLYRWVGGTRASVHAAHAERCSASVSKGASRSPQVQALQSMSAEPGMTLDGIELCGSPGAG